MTSLSTMQVIAVRKAMAGMKKDGLHRVPGKAKLWVALKDGIFVDLMNEENLRHMIGSMWENLVDTLEKVCGNPILMQNCTKELHATLAAREYLHFSIRGVDVFYKEPWTPSVGKYKVFDLKMFLQHAMGESK